MARLRIAVVLTLLGLLAGSAAAADADAAAAARDPLMRALDRELVRAFGGLRELTAPAPLYYLGYEARDVRRCSMEAVLGALAAEEDRRFRTLDVDARVGSPRLDSTHQLKGRGGRFELPRTQYTEIPIDDDEAALRAAIWKRTDQALKQAQTRFTTVQTNMAVTAREEDSSNDFSEEEAGQSYRPVSFPVLDKAAWRERLRRLSTLVRRHAFVHQSSVSLQVHTENRYIVTSEGTRVVDGNTFVRLTYTVSSRTDDGMNLLRSRSFDADDPRAIPGDEQLRDALEGSIAELEALLQGSIVEPYSGPAIFRNRATAVYFHEILGHRLEGHRQKLEAEGQTFARMIGKPVVADFISVYDDPTIERFGEQFLRGSYRFDDEGVAAQRVTLVRNGVLEGFLMGRSPIRGFPRSNGHGRRSAGRFTVARMGNTFVEAAETVSYVRLREMLIEEIRRQGKPYGYIFDDIGGGFTTTRREGPQSFKVIPHLVQRVHADGGPDETVRGVDIVGTPLTAFSRIVAAADDYDVFNGTCSAESGWVPVSGVAPSVLVSEIEIEKKSKSSEKPPILPPPHHAREERR